MRGAQVAAPHSALRVTAGYDRYRNYLDRHAVHTLMNLLNDACIVGDDNGDDQSDGTGDVPDGEKKGS